MEIILKKDVEGVGFKDDIVKVKNGYGRNFLIPQGKAIMATASARKVLEESLRQRAFKEKKIIEIAGRPSSSTHYSRQGCGSRHRDRGAPRISPIQIPAQYNLSSYHWHEWLPCR